MASRIKAIFKLPGCTKWFRSFISVKGELKWCTDGCRTAVVKRELSEDVLQNQKNAHCEDVVKNRGEVFYRTQGKGADGACVAGIGSVVCYRKHPLYRKGYHADR